MIKTRTAFLTGMGALVLALAAGCSSGAADSPTVSAATVVTPATITTATVSAPTTTTPANPTPVTPAAPGVTQTNSVGTMVTVYSVSDWTPPQSGSGMFDDPGVVVDAQVEINNTLAGDFITNESWVLTDSAHHIYTPSYTGPDPAYPAHSNMVMGKNVIRGLLKFDTAGAPAAGMTVRYWPNGAPYAPLLWTAA